MTSQRNSDWKDFKFATISKIPNRGEKMLGFVWLNRNSHWIKKISFSVNTYHVFLKTLFPISDGNPYEYTFSLAKFSWIPMWKWAVWKPSYWFLCRLIRFQSHHLLFVCLHVHVHMSFNKRLKACYIPRTEHNQQKEMLLKIFFCPSLKAYVWCFRAMESERSAVKTPWAAPAIGQCLCLWKRGSSFLYSLV